MAGDWIKLEINTFEKPEVMAITAAIGFDDPDFVVGKLAKVWRWFDQHTVNGNAENVTKSLLDRMVGVTGMCDAMAKVGWLIVTDNGIYLPNFDKHNGSSAKNRVETARRVAKHRDNNPVTKKTDRGIIPRPVRAAVMKAYSCTCVYCGRKEGEYAPPETSADAVMHVDHVVPLACGGEDSIANMVCACGACNRFKSDRTPDECGLVWPVDTEGNKIGVTSALPREEKIYKTSCSNDEHSNDDFEQFWTAYPKKQAKQDAAKAFRAAKLKPEQLQTVLQDIKRRGSSPDWQKDGGKFIPLPATYLRGKRWEDAPLAQPMTGAVEYRNPFAGAI